MNDTERDDVNLQIRKILKQFGVKAHNLLSERFHNDKSECDVSLKLEINGEKIEEIITKIGFKS